MKILLTGTIVAGDTKSPLPFVNIVPVNKDGKIITGKGATTDINGEYIIEIESGEKIKTSAIGYEPKTVAAADADMITLKPTSYKLKEVVVTPEREKPVQPGGGKKQPTYTYSAPEPTEAPGYTPKAKPKKKDKTNLYIGLSLLFVGVVFTGVGLMMKTEPAA